MIADRGYGSAENLTKLEEREVKTNIPLWSSRTGTSYFSDLEKGFIADNFIKDSAYCPEGHRMIWDGSKADNYKFKLPRETCWSCPKRETCLSETDKIRNQGKRFYIPMNKKVIEVKEQSTKPEFIKKMRSRMWKMEGIFAEAKSHHGLRRAKYRGRAKVQIQVYMISIVQNLKRLATTSAGLFKSFLQDLIRNLEKQTSSLNFAEISA